MLGKCNVSVDLYNSYIGLMCANTMDPDFITFRGLYGSFSSIYSRNQSFTRLRHPQRDSYSSYGSASDLPAEVAEGLLRRDSKNEKRKPVKKPQPISLETRASKELKETVEDLQKTKAAAKPPEGSLSQSVSSSVELSAGEPVSRRAEASAAQQGASKPVEDAAARGAEAERKAANAASESSAASSTPPLPISSEIREVDEKAEKEPPLESAKQAKEGAASVLPPSISAETSALQASEVGRSLPLRRQMGSQTPAAPQKTESAPQPGTQARAVSLTASTSTSTSSTPILYSDLNEYNFVDYAAIYFQRKKPRLFHSFSLAELTSYSTEVPLRPLHSFSEMLSSTVLEIERSVMIFMNITAGYVSEESEAEAADADKKLLEAIVYQSRLSQSVFDEVVCFTMKEIQNNPQETSCCLGFKLLYILLMMRRPSLPLLKYVLSFVYRQIVDLNVGGFACAILKEYLENPSPPVSDFQMSRLMTVYEMAEKGFKPFPQSLTDLSVQEIIETENFAGTLLSHGIMLPKKFFYAWHSYTCNNAGGLAT